MKNDNKLIPKLYAAIAAELDRREPYLKPRTLSEGDGSGRASRSPTHGTL